MAPKTAAEIDITLKDMDLSTAPLKGKKGLIIGIANDQSIAFGCAKAFKAFGADLAITYLNEKTKEYTQPIADALGASLYLPCDVRKDQMRDVFARIHAKWGKLDFALHSIAFAPREDLHGRVVDCSKEGFLQAMDVSVHSFIEMARYSEPLMKDGGSLFTMSYFGAEKVVENYNLMGPVKAALEASTRYMAAELGRKGIRVHAISPGPIATRAASGIGRFDELMEKAAEKAPSNRLITIDDVGTSTAILATDACKQINGEVIHVDGGYHIIG